jgi:hypothetical protein
LGSNKGIAAFKPSMLLMSVPSGGGMKEPLIEMSEPFTILPTIKPEITASIFLRMGCIIFSLLSSKYKSTKNQKVYTFDNSIFY